MKKIFGILLLVLATFGLAACGEEVVELDRISVTPPTKVEYVVGDNFNAGV